MVRRWSCLTSFHFSPNKWSRELIRIRKTRDYVRLRYYSFFPTWFLIKKQSFWYLRHDCRRLFSLFIDGIIFTLHRKTIFRFTDSFFSLQQSQSIFWSWRGRQEHFFSILGGTLVTTHINPKAYKCIHPLNWLYNSPERKFVFGEIHNLGEDEDHELGLTILKTSAELNVAKEGELGQFFTDVDSHVFETTKRVSILYYQIFVLLVLNLSQLNGNVKN